MKTLLLFTLSLVVCSYALNQKRPKHDFISGAWTMCLKEFNGSVFHSFIKGKYAGDTLLLCQYLCDDCSRSEKSSLIYSFKKNGTLWYSYQLYDSTTSDLLGRTQEFLDGYWDLNRGNTELTIKCIDKTRITFQILPADSGVMFLTAKR